MVLVLVFMVLVLVFMVMDLTLKGLKNILVLEDLER